MPPVSFRFKVFLGCCVSFVLATFVVASLLRQLFWGWE